MGADQPTRMKPPDPPAGGIERSRTVDLSTGGGPAAEPDSSRGGLPAVFGKYRLLEELGRGGMGVVYKARDTTLDRPVAVKMIIAGHLASADQVERFQEEARAAARVRHPNIVGIYEAGDLHGQRYIAMELIEGRSLAERAAGDPMPPEEVAAFVREIALAVAHLHELGIVHCDLKPSNVLLDRGEKPVLTDFGLARIFDPGAAKTLTDTIIGTPAYMSPEQAAGREKKVDFRSDIYSLGAILYDLLSGRPPFLARSPIDIILQVIERKPEPPRRFRPDIPRPLELICLKCLEKDPARRYPTALALAEDLRRFLDGEVVEAHPLGWLRRLQRWARREPALVSKLAAMAVFVGMELFWYHVLKIRPLTYHAIMLLLVAIWALLSVQLQRLSRSKRWANAAIYLWCGSDALFLTAALAIRDGVASPIFIIYFIYITATSLWFQERLIWAATALSATSYILLALTGPATGSGDQVTIDRHVITVAAMGVVGAVVAFQVRRMRALRRASRY